MIGARPGITAVFAQSRRGHLDTPPKFFRAMATGVNALATAFPVLNMGCSLASRDNRVTAGATCIDLERRASSTRWSKKSEIW